MNERVRRATIALSEAREALVSAADDVSDERMRELRAASAKCELELREALIEERDSPPDPEPEDETAQDAETRERKSR